MPPFIEARKRQSLIELGLDPDEYAYESDIKQQQKLDATSAEPVTSASQAMVTGARKSIGGTVGSLTAMAAVQPALSWFELAPGPGTLVHLAGTGIAGLAGGFIGGKAQSKIEPIVRGESEEQTQNRIAQEQKLTEEHPVATGVGELLPNFAAFRPDPKALANTVKGVGSGLVKSLSGDAISTIPQAQKNAMLNSLINATAGAGTSVAVDVMNGEDISAKRALKEAAVNALLFHEPTRLGQKVFGFKPSVGVSPEFSQEPIQLTAVDKPIGPDIPNTVRVAQATREKIPLQEFIDSSLNISQHGDVNPASASKAILEKIKQEILDEYLKSNPQELSKVLQENSINTSKSRNINPQRDYTEAMQETALANLHEPLAEAELIAHEMDLRNGDKYQPEETDNTTNIIPFSKVSLPEGNSYKYTIGPKESQLIRKEGITPSIDTSLIDIKKRGVSYAGNNREIGLNPLSATIDTVPHEVAHEFIKERLQNASEKEKALIQKWIDKAGGEEALVELTGKQWSNRTHTEGEKFKSFGRDMLSAVKSSVGTDSIMDSARLLSRKLTHDASYVERSINNIKPSLKAAVNIEDKNQGNNIINNLRPAIRGRDNTIIKGDLGDIHNDIISRQPMDWRIDNMTPERGFTTDGKNFYTRKEAGILAGLKPNEELHSEKLREIQQLGNDINNKFQPEEENPVFSSSTEKVLGNPELLKINTDKTGKLDSKQLLGRLSNGIIPSSELSVLKDLGLEKYLNANPKIHPSEFKQWVKDNMPKVEVHSYGQKGKVSKEKAELDALTHEWYDNLDHGQKQQVREIFNNYSEGSDFEGAFNQATQNGHLSRLNKEKLSRYVELKQKVSEEPSDYSGPKATSAYDTVSPKDTKKFPIQRVDVVLPSSVGKTAKISEHVGREPYPGLDDKTVIKPLWKQDDLHENLPNTLGWAAIQYENVGDKKIAHIFEAQSRWQQQKRKYWETYEKVLKDLSNSHPNSKETNEKLAHQEARIGLDYRPGMESPLDNSYQRLILKAAIEQARKEGATHIAISDAETAMMSEGHDLHSKSTAPSGEYLVENIVGKETDFLNPKTMKIEKVKLTGKIKTEPSSENRGSDEPSNSSRAEAEDGRWVVYRNPEVKKEIIYFLKSIAKPVISQEGGMRLNYDKVLPKIAEELTGDKGSVVNFGEHKNAFELKTQLEGGVAERRPWDKGNEVKLQRSNLIFKNADGTPKTDVTARLYSIENPVNRRNTGEPFSLFGNKYQNEVQTDTPEFKNWFGESKLIDNEGKPLVVYHGSGANFNTFKQSKEGVFGKGIYLTPSSERASSYAEQNQHGDKVSSGSVYPVYVSMKKPLEVELSSFNPSVDVLVKLGLTKEKATAIVDKAFEEKGNLTGELQTKIKNAGYDGLIIKSNGHVNEIVAFKPEQIKSAIGNSGEFNPSNPDIRFQDEHNSFHQTYNDTAQKEYSIPIVESEITKISKLGENGKKLAKHLTSFFEKFDRYTGHYVSSPLHELKKMAGFSILKPKELYLLNNERLKNTLQYAYDMQDHGKSEIVLSNEEQKILELFRSKLLESLNDRNSREGMHKGNATENYFPQLLDRGVADIIFNKPHSDKAQKYFRDLYNKYAKDNPDLSFADAKALAIKDLEVLRAGYSKRDINQAEKFGPLDDNAGKGLPSSWREKSLIDIYKRYFQRVSRRFAYNDVIENNQEVNSILKHGEQGLSSNEAVKNVMNDVYGYIPLLEPNRNAISGVIRASMLGPLTGIKDYASNAVLGMQHETPKQTIESYVYATKNLKKHILESIEAGVNSENITALEMGDNENTINSLLRRTRDTLATVQGRNFLEKVTRATAYGKGKFVAMDNLWQAHKGKISKTGEKFLNDFSGDTDWRQYVSKGEFPPEVLQDIAARYTQSLQGRYDYRDLPAIAQQGSFAPFLSLSRWSIGKLNNYQKYVVNPAINGNFRPLLTSTLGMIIGGEAINQLVQMVTNKKEKTPTTKEILQAFKDKDGDGLSALTYKLAALANLSGYAGFLSDISSSAIAIKFKNKPQALNNVLIEGVVNGGDIAKDLIEAMNSNDALQVGEVIKRVLTDYLQVARLGYSQLDKDTIERNEKTDKFRDLKVYKTTHGQREDVPEASVATPNNFVKGEERKFKNTQDINEAQQIYKDLRGKYVKESEGDVKKLKDKLSSLKQNSYQTVPNPRTDLKKFKQYMQYIKETQGEEAADKLLQDYIKRNRLNKLKSSMVR